MFGGGGAIVTVVAAVICRLEQRVENASGRGPLLENYTVATAPETSPVEFGRQGHREALRRGLARAPGVSRVMAGLGMIMWAFIQDLNQLKRDYPEHWETFIGNSQAVTCFGVMDNFTAEYISKMLGTSTVEHVNVQTSVGQSVAPMGPNTSWLASGRTSHSTSTSYSSQVMSRSLLNPDEIRNLGGDLSIIMGRFQPILCRRMVYYQDWRFLHRVSPQTTLERTEQVRWM